MKSRIYKLTAITVVLSIGTASAQLNPMKSQYFQNPYLVNPAMAGYEGKTSVFANYSDQWNKLEGSPVLLSLSASGGITEKAALGFNLITEKEGLIRRTQMMGSYAYKVALDENNSVRFGLSLSWAQDRLDQGEATQNGSVDPALYRYNEKRSYLDGNFGVSYIGKKLEAQFSYLNLNHRRQKQLSTVDYSTFYSSVGYKFMLDESSLMSVKPLFAYRGIKGYRDQWDLAAEWSLDQLKLYTMYHSNKSFSGGMGFLCQRKVLLSMMYSTEPQGLQGLTGGNFDLILGYQF